MTRSLNRRFDQAYARARLDELGIPPKRRAGKLSGGQQAQLALTLALARRPRLLVLDEPVAMLDPVARHDFMATVLAAAAADGVSVLLSSHVLTELERVADYLVLLSRGQVRLAGEVDDLLAAHGQASLEELAMAYPAREPDVGGDAMTALTMPARPDEDDAGLRPMPWRRMAGVTWRQHRIALAGVAVLLGALAVYLWIAGLPLHHAYAAAVACHPASSAACQGLDSALDGMDNFLSQWLHPAGAARADRGVRRGAGAGQGAGDRHLPVRLDPGLRPVALGARQAGAARGRGDRRGRRVRRPADLVLPAVRGQPDPRPAQDDPAHPCPVRPARGRVPRLDAGRLRDRRPGRDADPPGRPRDRRDPGRLHRARLRGRGVPAPALPDPAARISANCPTTRGSSASGGPRTAGSPSAAIPPPTSSTSSALPPRPGQGRAGLRKDGGRASSSTATRSGPATSRPAGSGPSSGSRAAGCSRCRRCSSPRPSGWSAAAPPDRARACAFTRRNP